MEVATVWNRLVVITRLKGRLFVKLELRSTDRENGFNSRVLKGP